MTRPNTIVGAFCLVSLLVPHTARSTDEAVQKPQSDAVVIGTTDDSTSLDPAATYEAHTWEILNAISGGLLMIDPSGQPVPVLAAEAPTSSEDGRRWTVRLRPDLRFASSHLG